MAEPTSTVTAKEPEQAGKKRAADEMNADTQHPSKRQKVEIESSNKAECVAEKRKAKETTEEPPKKKQKIDDQKKQARVPPTQIRKEILTQFANKKPDGDEILKFYQSLGIKNFKEAGQSQQGFFKFCEEHSISWNAMGEVSGPTDDFMKNELLNQVEFYFSDGNLPRDNFLLAAVTKKDNPDRWIQLKVLLRFGLVKKWTTQVEFLASALAPSTFLELNEAKTCVRRKNKLELTREVLDKQTTIVRGCSTIRPMKDFQEFFGKFGTVLGIFVKKQRKNRGGVPKGSVEIVWETEEVAKQFADLKKVTWDDVEMKISIVAKPPEPQKAKSLLDFDFIMWVKNLPEKYGGFGELKSFLKQDCGLPVRFVCLHGRDNAIVKLQQDEGISAEIAVEKVNGKQFKDKELVAEIIKEEEKAAVDKALKPKPPKGKKYRKRGYRGN